LVAAWLMIDIMATRLMAHGQRLRAAMLRRSAASNTPAISRIRNIAHLLSGNIASTAVGLASVALIARGLGPVDYGTFALTFSYTQAVERLVSFQSWQPLIRYGAELNDDEHRDDFKRLLKFGLMLDLSGSLAAWLIAISLALGGQHLFGWSVDTLKVVIVYSTVLLFGITGMPTAVLRLAGRFRMVAYGQVGGAVIRLAACAVGYAAGADLLQFAVIWMATQVLSTLTTLAIALHVLRKQNIRGLARAPLRGVAQRFPGLWRFTWTANLSLTLWSSAQQFDTLIVGALAGPQSAGLYHIAKRAGRLAQQVGAQVQAVVYPEVARLWAQGAVTEFRKVVRQVELALAGMGVVMVAIVTVAAGPLIYLAVGPQFAGAAPLLIAQIVAMALAICGSVTRSALLAMGRQRQVLQAVIASTVVFHAVAFSLVPVIGAMGANLAHIALGTTWLIGLLIAFRRALRTSDPSSAAA
jgi:O-antigen/teichoic acid export membrane protein